ncbi:hypothetical protein DY000_02030842 [Brassica cretica]|uniref:Uncharacterized protein n=1 Tax=Brassica cretica TaxID=69181 RepID=A0ABQ7DBA6_BRACR|nr:hypothetical protein DY000_02030842 [Brassica cretica]
MLDHRVQECPVKKLIKSTARPQKAQQPIHLGPSKITKGDGTTLNLDLDQSHVQSTKSRGTPLATHSQWTLIEDLSDPNPTALRKIRKNILPCEANNPNFHTLIILTLNRKVLPSDKFGLRSPLNTGYSPSLMKKSSNKGKTDGEKYSGIEFLQTPGRTPASGSPLRGTPVPRYEVLRVRSLGPPPSPGKRKTSDKENLPYFRIWKSLSYSNRLRPTLRRLYKWNLNPKARDRHFKT